MRAALPARRAARPLLAAAAQPAEPGPDDAEGASERLKRKAELKKMLPLGLMFFFILFNYTILRDTKDVLVVTAPKSGAEIIPFLKTYVNLPGAIGFTVLYSKLTNKYSRTNVFYGIVATFLAFFSAFAFFIYPNQARTRRAPAAHPPRTRRPGDASDLGEVVRPPPAAHSPSAPPQALLHPHGLADALAALLPAGFAAPIAILRNWTYAVFYTMAELWGSVVVSLLFWGFANEVSRVDEAKRYAPCASHACASQPRRARASHRASQPPPTSHAGTTRSSASARTSPSSSPGST